MQTGFYLFQKFQVEAEEVSKEAKDAYYELWSEVGTPDIAVKSASVAFQLLGKPNIDIYRSLLLCFLCSQIPITRLEELEPKLKEKYPCLIASGVWEVCRLMSGEPRMTSVYFPFALFLSAVEKVVSMGEFFSTPAP